MSVINNVLKDLENRSSQFTPIDIALVENLSVRKPEQTVSYAFILILIVLLAGLSSGLYLFQQKMAAINKQAEVAMILPAPITQPAQQAVGPGLPSNQIIDLQIQESVDDMKLDFSLREKVVSYLKERTENSFVYHLKNIQSEIVAPVISQNRWIKQFSLTTKDEGVDVSFRTLSGVLVETRQNLEDGQQIWSIKLKKAASPAQIVRHIDAPVIKPVKSPETGAKKTKTAETRPEPKIKATIKSVAETKVVKLDIKSTKAKLSSSEQLLKARLYIKSRRWREAETLLLALIGGRQDLAARTLLLSIYQQRQQFESFSILLSESMELYPQQALFKTELARSLFQNQSYSKVITLLAAQADANAPQLALLAASHQRLDQHQQALDYYQQSLDKDARQAKNWIGLGISQEQTAQFEAALRSYTTAAKLGRLNSRLQNFVDSRMEHLKQVVN